MPGSAKQRPRDTCASILVQGMGRAAAHHERICRQGGAVPRVLDKVGSAVQEEQRLYGGVDLVCGKTGAAGARLDGTRRSTAWSFTCPAAHPTPSTRQRIASPTG